MLELQHVSYEVEEDGEKKQILKDINLTIEDGTFCQSGYYRCRESP